MKVNPWFPAGNSASAVSPSIPSAGDSRTLIPPIPPDPPDPSNLLSLSLFPPLNSPVPNSSKTARASPRLPSQKSVEIPSSPSTAGASALAPSSTSVVHVPEIPRSESGSLDTVHCDLENYKILPPKTTSPIQTNMASNPPPLAPLPSIPCPNPTLSPPPPQTLVILLLRLLPLTLLCIPIIILLCLPIIILLPPLLKDFVNLRTKLSLGWPLSLVQKQVVPVF